MFDINYEDEISCKVIEQFSNMYGIEDERVLYRYIYLRFLCGYIDKRMDWLKKISVSDFDKRKAYLDFFINELNLPIIDNKLIYNGVTVSFWGGISNCFNNVIESWEFSASLHPINDLEGNSHTFDKCIEMQWNKISNYAKNKSKKYKNNRYYAYYLKYFAFKYLNDIYGINENNIKQPSKIEGFKYSNMQENCNLPIEQQCKRYIHASRFVTNNVEVISEKDLEDFLVKNIDIIEDGLIYVARQVTIENGRLDILAKDKEGILVIIELKVVEDKELIWQGLYYPYQYMKENRVDKIRFITLCPQYPEHIRIPLSQNELIEMIKYDAFIENGKITGLKLNKII